MKKILVIAMALSALGVVMSGCSPAAETPKEEPKTDAPAEGKTDETQ